MTNGRQVVITGAGLVSPLGIGVGANWERIKRMDTGIVPSGGEGPSFLRYRGAARELEGLRDVPAKLRGQVKFLNRGSVLGFEAAREAFLQAGADLGDVAPGRRGLFIASGDHTQVGCSFMYEALKDATNGTWDKLDPVKLNEATLFRVNPFFLLESIMNNLFSSLSAFLECMGPNTTLASDSPCGGDALELAARSIENGTADTALAVGCGNWITEVPLYEMAGLGLLSRCSEGARSFRPFDRRSDGFIPGEGGAALFLETEERAKRRGAKVLGRLLGFGNSLIGAAEARRPGLGSEVSAASMRAAMDEAGLDAEEYAFICGHGTASPEGDRSELRSLLRIFGPEGSVPVCGLKAYTGHLGAASDIGEIILSLKAVSEETVPATLHFEEAEEEFRGLRILGRHEAADRRHFLASTYGVAGKSSAVVVGVP